MICLAAVDDDAIRPAVALQCLAEEALCRRQVTVFAEEEFNRVADVVDGAIEVRPLAANLDSRFPPSSPPKCLGVRPRREALIEAGYRRIAHVSGEAWMKAAADRRGEYCNALTSHGLKIIPELIVEGSFLPGGGYAATRTLLSLPQPPDAIFCVNETWQPSAPTRRLRKRV